MMMLIGQIQSGPLSSKHYDVVVKLFDMFNKMNGNYKQEDTSAANQNITINITPVAPKHIVDLDATDFEILKEDNNDLLPLLPPKSMDNLQAFLSDE